MSRKEDRAAKREKRNVKRDLISIGLVAVVFVMQFFVIRYGIFGEKAPDPDEMSYKEKLRYAQENGMVSMAKKGGLEMTKTDLALMLYGAAVSGGYQPEDGEDEDSLREGYVKECGSPFSDVDESKLSGEEKTAIYWCASKYVLYPSKEGKFGAEDKVTNQDLIVAMRRLASSERLSLTAPETKPAEITDKARADEYAREAIDALAKAGMLAVMGGKAEPKEAAVFSTGIDMSIRMRNALDADKKREAEEYEPVPDLYGLRAVFKKTTKDFEGTWSMYVKCFDTGETLVIGNKQMISASLIKLFVAGTYFDELKKGNIKEDVNSKDDLHLMISESSNTAWTDLEGFIGKGSESAGIAKVNDFAEDGGYKSTARHVAAKEGGGTANYTSVSDVGRVLDKIYYGKYVSKKASKRILDEMLKQVHVNKIPAGIPEGVKIANKTGELNTNEHDSAIVWTKKCTYAIVIMTEDVNRAQIGYRNVADLSEAVYLYMTQ